MSAKKFDCPYCGHRLRDVFNEIASGKHGHGHHLNMVICTGCGEPIFMDLTNLRIGWRKPTDKEFEHMVDDPSYIIARQAWVHLRTLHPDDMLVERSFQDFTRGFPVKAPEGHMGHFTLRAIYMTAFSNVLRILEAVGDPRHPEGFFDMQTALMKAELNKHIADIYDEIEKLKQAGKI